MLMQSVPVCGNGIDAGRNLGHVFIIDLTDKRPQLRHAVEAAVSAYGLHHNDKRPYLLLLPKAPERKEAKRAQKAMLEFARLCPYAVIAKEWREHVESVRWYADQEVEEECLTTKSATNS